jgi:predicted GNAT family N-acyltransferase
MELVALHEVTERQWEELIEGEREPWGAGPEQLSWREKTHNVGIRARDGTLLAVAGSVLADVEIARSGRVRSLRGDRPGGARFSVLGIGGVFVAPRARGRGLVARLLEGLLTPGRELGPERAMLFCRQHLVRMYHGFDFREIDAPVWAEQPAGRLRMPLAAMWRPLRADIAWPEGRVDLLGLPF